MKLDADEKDGSLEACAKCLASRKASSSTHVANLAQFSIS